ncbi:restriction endonuclease subunit S [Burkholderia pseudomallei]|uniref:restriction endonuclease subunit S n=1 Tax=Burkholderia pseudomallei TaxID=28450 RepID=UPI0009789F31|nr:restriction endonuclease subunit S [Burkholderia pseudomallei]AYX34634.1 restriction endonuclease subunit S [Burkholderia pseudomallei]
MKPGHKQTEVGTIPDEWQVVPFLSAVQIANGQVDPRIEPYRSMILIAPDHIESGSGRLIQERTASAQAAISGKYLFDSGDIVYSKIRPYLRKATIAKFQGLCSADMYPLKTRKGVESGFVLPVILGHRFSIFAEGVSARTGIPKINREDLSAFSIALPPQNEQRAIATALSDVDALLSSLDALIAKKRDIKQAAMQQLLTGKTRLPGFGGEWELKRVGDVLTIRHGRDQKAVISSGGQYPILATGGQIGWAKQWLYNRPSVLIGRKGTIDRPQYMDQPFWTVDTLFYSELKSKNVAKYFYYRFCLIDWPQYNEASGVPSLNARTIETIELACPAPEEQTAIAQVLSDMDAELAALEARRDKTRLLKQGMMQELLTGKTRLV